MHLIFLCRTMLDEANDTMHYIISRRVITGTPADYDTQHRPEDVELSRRCIGGKGDTTFSTGFATQDEQDSLPMVMEAQEEAEDWSDFIFEIAV